MRSDSDKYIILYDLANNGETVHYKIAMTKKKAKNSDEATNSQSEEITSSESNVSGANFTGELNQPFWSVVNFYGRIAINLTYAEAERRIAELQNQNISGLCIITDEAAERISKKV